jgi:hypothetical protein
VAPLGRAVERAAFLIANFVVERWETPVSGYAYPGLAFLARDYEGLTLVLEAGPLGGPMEWWRFWWHWREVIGSRCLQESVATFEGTSNVPLGELGSTRIIRGPDANVALGADPFLQEALAQGRAMVRYQFCTGDQIVDVWATTPPEITRLPAP